MVGELFLLFKLVLFVVFSAGAVYNISLILTSADIFKGLREWLGIEHIGGVPADVHYVGNPNLLNGIRHFFGRLLGCIHCTSVWVAIALMFVYLIYEPAAWVVSAIFLLSYLGVFRVER